MIKALSTATGAGMALCRLAYFPRPSNQILAAAAPTTTTTTTKFPTLLPLNYHYKFAKFPSLPHLPHKDPLSNFSLRCSHSSSSSASMEAPPEGYRRNVGICLINPDKKIGYTQCLANATGGIDEGEDPRAAAIRELREETGVNSAEVVAEAPYWLTYDFPPKVREKPNVQWGSDWKGQAQKWFLFKFTGQDQEINLLGDGTEKAEFGEWSWMSPEQVIGLAVDFKKPVYKEVLAAFTPYLQ